MDRLLIVDPHEIVFDFELGQRFSSFITLKNVMLTMPVAFKIISPAAGKKYTMKPGAGIIPPAGRTTVEIVLNPQASLPDEFPLSSADKFVVKSLVVPGGNQHSTVSNDWFESKRNFVYSDKGLSTVFKGAAIVRALMSSGSMEDVRELLERGVDLNRPPPSNGLEQPPLHVAIASGRPEMVLLLLEFGADVDLRDRSGKTPLHEAAASGQTLIVELLLANGAQTETRTDSIGWAAVHFATNSQHHETLRVLLAKGANVNAVAGAENRTPLHIAASTSGSTGRDDCLRVLLESGADANAVNAAGQTALHIAAAQADVSGVRLLLRHGSSRNVRDAEGHIPFDLAVDAVAENEILDVLKLGDDLRRGARKGDLKMVRVALKQGADVNGRDQNGWTALHGAAFKGHVDVVRWLVERRSAEVDCVDTDGYTPLMCATEMGHTDVVRVLLRGRADVNVKSKKGLTVVQIGKLAGEEGAVSLLVEGGARNSAVDGKRRGADETMMKKGLNNGDRFGSRRQSFELLAC